ncbi:YibE/F family protein [Sporosarcina trichiuri]|uniref:YibE/F family protein n=1 Tax=Sporosarcina trichiuri TaxID=3056445 RepID=UPI0025B60BCD|nr:YibE/F family protein [Sporosarcina sp. 0.2-SM1T-5]WJY27558.1 YibE/F family protein [Sporosarcina sp. 0.2-SM1T-5]
MNGLTLKKLVLGRQAVWLYAVLAVLFVGSLFAVHHNESLYDRPIGLIVKTHDAGREAVTDEHGNRDTLVTQQLVAEVRNGEHKGEWIALKNIYSHSGVYDQQYEVGNRVFLTIGKDRTADGLLTGQVIDLKRDGYVVLIAWLFVLILLAIGRRKGMLALVSFAANVLILTVALELYTDHFPKGLLIIAGVCAVLFTVVSLLLVSGFNEKTYAAIIATLIATAISLAIAAAVIWLMDGKGLRYEEMQFLTRPYRTVFFAGLFIGSLGAIMDTAITISSSLFALQHRNPDIPMHELKMSGLDIGKDIMGTITSILFFAYLTGSLPMLLLYLRNASSLSFALPMNLSLEVARALTGGIGIVLSIPITLYTVLYFIRRRRAAL